MNKLDKLELVSSEGDFTLYVRAHRYKTYKIEKGYIKNTKTGENCGKEVTLYKRYYDNNGTRLKDPIYDEDCYEFVLEQCEVLPNG